MSAIPDDKLPILEKKGFAHLATIGPAGEPQSKPLWYEWDGERLLLSSTKARQNYKNMSRNPNVAVSIVDPDNPYSYLEIRGTVTLEDDPRNTLIDALAKKYLGKDQYPWHQPGDERVIAWLSPAHVTG